MRSTNRSRLSQNACLVSALPESVGAYVDMKLTGIKDRDNTPRHRHSKSGTVFVMNASNRWLGLLGAAVVLSFARVSAHSFFYSSSSSSDCIEGYYGDGDCDSSNNKAECGYDGGDCCSCTCVDTEDYTCGMNDFACIDPEAACVDDDDITAEMFENCGRLYSIGDGYCDQDNNKAECGYDGGDCCSCTCTAPENSWDDDYSCARFACIDPGATCVDDDDVTADMVENCGYVFGLGNGYCDQDNNKAECAYDGGDCCSCTCTAPENSWDDDYSCSEFGCIDPEATCVDDDDITAEMVENCGYVHGIGNGYCDQDNNKAECAYDGGDCCSCTCTVPETEWDDDYGCFEFACIDPAATCVDDDGITAEMVTNCGYVHGIGNGYCDQQNNNAECGYDGGDCCSCTCTVPETEWDDDYGCRHFACIDPEATCVEDDDITVGMVENCDYVEGVGNGDCDERNNNALCNYDGGDCCECTCVPREADDDWNDYVSCGGGFACIDPEAECVNDDDINVEIVANCDSVQVGNGYCDQRNNIAECGYDGGDCCECTCEDRPNQKCGQNGGYTCIDPEAACVNDDDITVDMIDLCQDVGGIGDGYCDQNNNKPECNYDGGDCCECTCVAPDDWNGACGRWAGFACIDPDAACVDDDSVTIDMLENCDAREIGDGFCDDRNNNAECAYDGGDCCDCTCVSSTASTDDDFSCSDFSCIDPAAACVDDDDITTEMLENCRYVFGIGNGYCNQDNNKAECGYDGGDCCECTCIGDENAYDSGGRYLRYSQCNSFACIDPDAACVEDDDITADMIENCGRVTVLGDGYCDRDTNNEECGWDGGDCCSCTCINPLDDDWACSADGAGFYCLDTSAPCYGEDPTLFSDDQEPMSYEFVEEFVPWEQEGSLPTLEGAVEVGTKTEVSVSATAYDVRPGAHGGMSGCGEAEGDGCAPANTRDGISSDIESRWSCAMELVEDEGPCVIEYTFGEPQDIMDIQVAFWNEEERIRTLDVHFGGVRVHTHESYAGSAFDPIGVSGTGVITVALESKDLLPSEWISILEVLIFVTP
ncbi:unnamed protein product [Pylaiella littoralis]